MNRSAGTFPVDRSILAGLTILAAVTALVVIAGQRGASHSFAGAEPQDAGATEESPDTPIAFRGRGRLVCLAEEMKARFGAEVQPVHTHVLGFRLEEPFGPGLRHLLLLRTAQSEALYVDERFAKHTLILTGRVFPGTGILEVSAWQWERDGRLYDLYYWCEVCTIRGVTPGACACCQAEVELRERLVPAAAER